MANQCEFCDELDIENHLLECEMVLSYLFAGTTTLSFPDEMTIELVNVIKKPRKLPILRWKNIRELCESLRGTNNSTMMYI